MSDTFDWAGLWREVMSAEVTFGVRPASDILRTRIEAAFVSRAEYDKLGMGTVARGTQLARATARTEAAEARNKVLEMHVDILEQALIDHNCGSPSCICVGCIEKRDPALGAEHGK